MKRFLNESALSTALIVSSVLVVLVLALLLYWWSNQVSETTTVRLADSLQMSMVNWHLNLFRNLSDVCVALRVDSDDRKDPDRYVKRFAEWSAATPYPELVARLYLLKSNDSDRPQALRLDSSARKFEETQWDDRLNRLWQKLPQQLPAEAAPAASDGRGGRRQFSDSLYPPGGFLEGWGFEPGIPALVRRISGNSNRRQGEWIVVELNLRTLQQRILPELAERYFTGVDGLDYMIAVVAETGPRRVVYSSDPDFAARDVPDADGRMDVFGDVTARAFGSPIRVFHKLSQNAGLSGLAASIGSSWFPLIGESAETQGWQLIVRHRRGGALGAFVAEMHRRDLAISFGVLLLLVISVAMLVVTSQRARRLAKLQMEFVTAVSHELRSPLAIISSAAENIAEGVVDTRPQMTQYGSVIERQARRLSRLVEEILLFAATRENRHRYAASELDLNEIIDAALAATADLIQASQFTIEREIPAALPRVIGDRFALSQCLQNLITNALKYGGPERWIGIRTSVHGDKDATVRGEIRIEVSDHGMGIEATDLPHIFEPFYRSPSVTAAQIYGTGLGLSLAKSIAEAMGGRLTVVSLPRTGSTFTLHLPFAQPLVNANQDSGGDARLHGRLDDPLRAVK